MMSANVRYAVFGGTLLIRNASDGKKYLYDIVSIKENTGLAFDLNKKASGRQKAVSAYTKTRSQERTVEEAGRTFLQNSDVLYMDEKRAASVLRRMGYYTPIELPRNGYIGTIAHKAGGVKIDGTPFWEVVSGRKGEFSMKNAPTYDSTGRELSEHKDRKKRTILFAAPVELNGIRGNMGVVVNANGNHYYAHRIVLPDGSAFEFLNKANAVPTTVGGITENAKFSGEVAPTINTASTLTIRQNGKEVKRKFSLKNAPTVEYLSPEEITTMNGITNSEMCEYLTDDIRRNGYSGRPVVVYETPYGYQALTGSHRVAAAREAGIEIPAVVIYDGDVIDRLEAEHDDTSRAKAAVELFEEGLIDEATRDLLLREDELNSENYGVPQQHARRNNQQHRHRDQTRCRCFHIV